MTSRRCFLFIVTYGRSGSTLLQGILNSEDTIHVLGENQDLVYHMYQCFQTLRDAKRRYSRPIDKNSTHPWYGIESYSEELLANTFSNYLWQQIGLIGKPDASIRGYKEIRYMFKEDLGEYLNFLKNTFVDSLFVFNFRNLDDVIRSGFWAEHHDQPGMVKLMQRFEAVALAFHAENPQRSVVVRYDDYVKSPDALKPLYALLGIEFDAAKIEKVLAVPHDYKTAGRKA